MTDRQTPSTPSGGSMDKMTPEQQHQVLFMMLVQQHQQIAMMGMGESGDPDTGEKQVDLSAAKYAIDTLHMLSIFTKGNLIPELGDYLDSVLSELRMSYEKAEAAAS